jgi:hypothetical protein
MRFRDRPADLRRLRPQRSLFWQALGGTLAFLLPVSALLFVTLPDGPWQIILALQIVCVVAFLAAYFSYRNLGFWVGPSGIAERGFFGRTQYFPREEVDSILLVNTYHGAGTETVPQLFVCDANGKQLLRMRGQFWSLASMEDAAEALDVPLTFVSDEVSKTELLDSHPGLLYWFERHPLIIAAVSVGSVAIVAAVIWLIMSVTG